MRDKISPAPENGNATPVRPDPDEPAWNSYIFAEHLAGIPGANEDDDPYAPHGIEWLATQPTPRPHRLHLHLEHDLWLRLERVAQLTGLSCQDLIKEYLLERLYEEEKRRGLLEAAPP
ncbi:hypothetical protein HNR42_001179 [Deinobacterium chartae]|uniref:Uncharacterized protein n=1 Tax=Deinobacterium chartae TaxID=521158 RepID=A0A841I0Z4_9DEIO|nr:hypothetical protein [Deinobacterium chartae]MBB6097762.1 hypothetical protein [Deinobacterium chartae]